MKQDHLTQQKTHFAFGKNWKSYTEQITAAEIDEAKKALIRLLGVSRLDGERFLDIGCGSGLHSLAALHLGAKEVIAVDLDPDSVSTTQALLQQHAPKSASFLVEKVSVFDLNPETFGVFDIVYSWGVLHHTGDMDRAIRSAAQMCAPRNLVSPVISCPRVRGGVFSFALYRRTWIDWFWRIEKRWYAKATPSVQCLARTIYITLFKLGLLATGRSFGSYIANYRNNRGMDFYHDVHDWMGGWPYQSVQPSEVNVLMSALGFKSERVFLREGHILGRNLGFFGSGCDEYVYRRLN